MGWQVSTKKRAKRALSMCIVLFCLKLSLYSYPHPLNTPSSSSLFNNFRYGNHGFEMINVTYSGDKLIAYKVTGDKNIPRRQVTFTADVSPKFDEIKRIKKLDPIVLSEASAKKWGTKRLPRFPGPGHAAEPGFANSQFMEGQLVVIGGGDYFSFAWIPLEHQVSCLFAHCYRS